MILLTAPLPLSAQTDNAAGPPKSAEELAARYRSAHAARDTDAVKRLFFWGTSTPTTRELLSSFIAQDVSLVIKGVFVAPLEASDLRQYTQAGVTEPVPS